MKSVSLSCFIFLVSFGIAQDTSTISKSLVKQLFIGIGGVNSFHQDTRSSTIQYKGIGFGIYFGGNAETSKRISYSQLTLQSSTERPSTIDRADIFTKNTHFSLFYRYLFKFNDQYSIGSRVELINGYFRKTEGLSNNGVNYLMGNSWYISGRYYRSIHEKWAMTWLLDLSLFSIQKGTTGFAFNSPHRIIDQGKFNYQDNFDQPTNLKGYGVEPLWRSFALKSSLLFSYQSNFKIGYNWMLGRFVATKKHPIYRGYHSLVFHYSIFNKKKSKFKKNHDL